MPRRTLLLLLLLLVVSRGALVLSLADVFFYGEELAKGTAAKAMLDGIPIEHWKLNYVYHEGGGFVVTHLKALAFLLVGENVLAHKLVALLITALILAAGFAFVHAAFGRRAATVFGVLFVLAPAPFVRFSLLNVGTHFEALLFLTLVVHLTLRIAEAETARTWDLVWLGFAAGFGLYFSLQTAPAIAAAAAYLLLFARRKIVARGVSLVALAFLVGITPWIYTGANVGLAAVSVRGQNVLTNRGMSARAAIAGLFEPLRGQADPLEVAALIAYPLVILLGFAPAGARGEVARWRRRALLPLFVLVVFLAAYGASGLVIGSRGQWTFFWRLSTLWFFANVLFAAGAANLLAHGSRGLRLLASVATALLVVAGIEDYAALMRTGAPAAFGANARQLVSFKGYDYIEYFDKLKNHLDGAEHARIGVLLHFEEDPAYLLPSIEHSLFDRSRLPIAEVLAIARARYGERWLESLKGLGPYLAPSGNYDVVAAFGRLAEAPTETHAVLAEAIGRTGRSLRATQALIDREIAGEDVPEHLRASFWRGTGARLFQLHRLRPERALARIDRAAEPARSALRAGFDAAQRARALPRVAFTAG